MSEQQSQKSDGDVQIKLYLSTLSGNKSTVSNQNKIISTLEAKKIDFITLDIASNPEYKEAMRISVGDSTAVAPQICNGDVYCGNFEQFTEANEVGELFEFLKLPPRPKVES